MLDRVEMVMVGLSGLIVVALLGGYFIMGGAPSTSATSFLPGVREIPAPRRTAASGGTPTPAPAPLTQPDRAVLDKLKANSRSRIAATRLERKSYAVPAELYEEIKKPANYTRELKKARSQLIGGTRLKVYGISNDSLLRRFGFQDDDIIELIDGEVVEFSEGANSTYLSLFKDKMETLRSGGAISITITRNKIPLHLEFKL